MKEILSLSLQRQQSLKGYTGSTLKGQVIGIFVAALWQMEYLLEQGKRNGFQAPFIRLARESDRLNEEKQKILVTLAEDKGRQEKKAELIDFLHEQTTEFEEFDDGLVRRLIEQITVHESGTFTVECKSGTMVEV